MKQSTSHPDLPGEATLNLASGAEIISNNGGVKHVSTESELVKEAFSDPCFLKQVGGLEAMLRVRARASPGSSAIAENDTVLKQENGALAGVVENDLALKAVNGENDSESELLECADVLADRCPPCAGRSHVSGSAPPCAGAGDVRSDRCPPCAGRPREKARAQKWCSDSGAVDARRDTDADRPGVSSRIHDGISVNSSSASSLHVSHTLMRCLLLLLVHLLPQLHFARLAHLLLLVCACMMMAHLCMVLVIQVVLVASCLCRGPPVTAWIIRGWTRLGYRVPTGTKRVKGGVSGPAEDLRPVAEVAAGVILRPAGGVRGQVAGSLSRKQPGAGTRRLRVGVDTHSLHPEVPGIQFVSPGRGLDIRQSMGWTKVCGTAQSGTWVVKGNARTRMLPENLDYLRVGMDEAGYIQDCLGYARARLSVFIQVWTWSSSQTANQQRHLGWGYWFVGQGCTPLVALVCKWEYANGSELELVRWSRIKHSLAQR